MGETEINENKMADEEDLMSDGGGKKIVKVAKKEKVSKKADTITKADQKADKEIEIYKSERLEGTTRTEIQLKYQSLKEKGSLEAWVLDSWFEMEVEPAEPQELVDSSIPSIRVKTLLGYCLPVFEG